MNATESVYSITNWTEPSERIAINNCSLRSRSAAVRLGHLASKVRNVILSNLIVHDSQRGIGVFAGDGGYVRNVLATNLILETRIVAGHWWGNGEPLVVSAADSTGEIQDISLAGVRARSENGVVIWGHRRNIRDIQLVDWKLELGYGKNRPLLGKQIDLQPAKTRPAPDARQHIPWLTVCDTGEVRVRHVRRGRGPNESASFRTDAMVEQAHLIEADVYETHVEPS